MRTVCLTSTRRHSLLFLLLFGGQVYFSNIASANAAEAVQDTVTGVSVDCVDDVVFNSVAAYHRTDPEYDDSMEKAVLKDSAVHFTQSQSTQAKDAEYKRQEEERIAREEAERQAQAAAQRATASAVSYGGGASSGNSGGGNSGGDGAWHVNYRNEYGTPSAAADGAVTQWDDNYYIAHNWSDNGKMITSQPEYVEVNGTTYKFAGSQEVARDTYYDDIKDWVGYWQ